MVTPPGGNPQRDANRDIPVADARDASFMRLDTTNSDVVVYSKNGDRFHFTLPCCTLGTAPVYVQEIEDRNGNVVAMIESKEQMASLMTIFNLGYLAVFTVFVLLYCTHTVSVRHSN